MKKFKPNPAAFKNTFCVFNEVDKNTIETIAWNYISKSGSSYYYTELGMFRLSNHWGRLANSKWRLVALDPESNSKTKLGFALWQSFFPDNSVDKLYYLEVDFTKKSVNYQHKNNSGYKNEFLRTTFETTKRIRQIRNLFERTSWAKHFENSNIDALRNAIITKLLVSNQTLEAIKHDISASKNKTNE